MKSRDAYKALLEEEIDAYHLRLKAEKIKNRSRKRVKRAMRFFLDSSDASVDLGSRSTRAVIKSGLAGGAEASKDAAIASDVFSYAGFAVNAIYTLLLPAIYIYARVSGQPVPFMSMAVRWGVSAAAVALSIIAIAFPPAAFAIGFVGSAIVVVASAVGLALTIKARVNSANAIEVNKTAIRAVGKEILDIKVEYEKERLNLRAIIEKSGSDELLTESATRLQGLSKQFSDKSNELSALRHQERELFVTYKTDHSNAQLLIASSKLLVAILLLVGLALLVNPFTIPVGAALIGTGAILGFSMYIAGKSQEQIIHKQQKALKHPPLKPEKSESAQDLLHSRKPVPVASAKSVPTPISLKSGGIDVVEPVPPVDEPKGSPGIKTRG